MKYLYKALGHKPNTRCLPEVFTRDAKTEKEALAIVASHLKQHFNLELSDVETLRITPEMGFDWSIVITIYGEGKELHKYRYKITREMHKGSHR